MAPREVLREDTVLQDAVSEQNYMGDRIIHRGQAGCSPKRTGECSGGSGTLEQPRRVWQMRSAHGSYMYTHFPAWGSLGSWVTLFSKSAILMHIVKILGPFMQYLVLHSGQGVLCQQNPLFHLKKKSKVQVTKQRWASFMSSKLSRVTC